MGRTAEVLSAEKSESIRPRSMLVRLPLTQLGFSASAVYSPSSLRPPSCFCKSTA